MADENMQRLDVLLTRRGLFQSRERSKLAIDAARVFVNGVCAQRASQKVEMNADIEILPAKEYASRGAYKLSKALEVFGIDLNGKVCADIGASTGGFTQIMLEHGAMRVYSIDVGRDQLIEYLRKDKRVVVLEKTDIRLIMPRNLTPLPEFCAVDLSFISLSSVLENITRICKGEIVALIKPQFELTKADIGKKGVVKDKAAHLRAIENVIQASQSLDLKIHGLIPSPIKGKEGNTEYLVWLSSAGANAQIDKKLIIEEAFGENRSNK